MIFIHLMWVLLAIVVLICVGTVIVFGWVASLKFVKDKNKEITIALGVIAMLGGAVAFHIDKRESRIEISLKFREKADSGQLQKALETINMFWIRGKGAQFLADYRKVEETGSIDEIIVANDALAEKTKKCVQAEKLEDEILVIYKHYRDFIICVDIDRCHKGTACQIVADEIQNFHELYSEIFLQWQKLQGGNFTEDLKYFHGDCGDDRIIGGQRSNLQSYLTADLMS